MRSRVATLLLRLFDFSRGVLPLVARFVLYFALLAAPWPGLALAYARTFSAAGNAALALGRVDSNPRGVELGFVPAECPAPAMARACWSAGLTARRPGYEHTLGIPIDTRALGYLPLAAFVALALAGPELGWRRKSMVLAGGVVAMSALTALFAALPLLFVFSEAGVMTPELRGVYEWAYPALVEPGTVFVAPLLVWWGLIALTRPRAIATGRLAAGIGFALRYAAVALVFLLLYFYPYPAAAADRAFAAYLGGYAQLAGAAIGLVEPGVLVHGTQIVGRYALEIVKNCDAIEVEVLFAAAVLAFPAPGRRRLLALCCGLLLLVIANIARITALYFVGLHAPRAFEFFHLEVFPLLLVLLASLAFLASAAWMSRAR